MREWTVLLVGGASGTGKSTAADELARHFGVNVFKIDDLVLGLRALTTEENLPKLHYWNEDRDWKKEGVSGNVEWLKVVSFELAPALKAIIDDHLEENVPIILEGDFIDLELVKSLESKAVKSLFILEDDEEQLVSNYLEREKGERQEFRAEISAEYSRWLEKSCEALGLRAVKARPWDTLLERELEAIEG